MSESTMRPPRQARSNQVDLSGQKAETPSEQVIKRGTAAPVTITDDLGRTLKIRKLGIADQMRIRRVLGADLSRNEQYITLATLAFCVAEMDGETVIPPSGVREVEHFVDRLGEEGARAIGQAYADAGWITSPDDNPTGFDLDAAKN